MAYEMYLDGMRMPVTPSKIDTKIKNRNQTITLISDGEVNLLKSAGLTDISFTLLIPQVRYPFASYEGNEFTGASAYLDLFERLKGEKKPFRLIVSRYMPAGKQLFDTNILVSMEDYSISEDAGNGFDLEVSVNLKQYREFFVKTAVIEAPNDDAPVVEEETRPGNTQEGKITVKYAQTRSEPRHGTKKYETLRKGDRVEILEKTGNWYKIVYKKGDGGIAWISAKHAKII